MHILPEKEFCLLHLRSPEILYMLLNFNANSMLRKACTAVTTYATVQKRTKSHFEISPFFPQHLLFMFKLLGVSLRSFKLSKKSSAKPRLHKGLNIEQILKKISKTKLN